jgi:hypothetical protein
VLFFFRVMIACRVAGAYRLLLVGGLLVFSCFVLLAFVRGAAGQETIKTNLGFLFLPGALD